MNILQLLRNPKKNKRRKRISKPLPQRVPAQPVRPSTIDPELKNRAEFYLSGLISVLNRLEVKCDISKSTIKITGRFVALGVRLHDPTQYNKATETNTLNAMAHGAGVQHVLLEHDAGVLYYLFPIPDAESPKWSDPDVDRQTIGISALGKPVRLDHKVWDKGHLLVSGITGSGKSWLLDTVMFSIAQTYPKAGFIIIDPAGDHFIWEQTRHMLGPIANERSEIAAALSFAAEEAHRRVVSREWVEKKEELRKWFVIIDEADGTEAFPSDCKELVTEVGRTLAVDGRKAQVHMVFGTHRPASSDLKPVIEVCATKILGQAFDARTSGQYGAGLHLDWLQGAGDFIWKVGDITTRFQSVVTKPEEIKRGVLKREGILRPFPLPKNFTTDTLGMPAALGKNHPLVRENTMLKQKLHAIDPEVLTIVLAETTNNTSPDKLVLDLHIPKEVAEVNFKLARAVEIHFRRLKGE